MGIACAAGLLAVAAAQPVFRFVVIAAVTVGALVALVWGFVAYQPPQRDNRLRHRRCDCGYDLRESRARCPECGRLIPPGR